MAKKGKTVFVCQECGYESPKWMGQCICGAWNTFVEEKVVDVDANDKRRRTSGAFKRGGSETSGMIDKAAEPVKSVSYTHLFLSLSLFTAFSLYASHARWIPPMPLTARMPPADRSSCDLRKGSSWLSDEDPVSDMKALISFPSV